MTATSLASADLPAAGVGIRFEYLFLENFGRTVLYMAKCEICGKSVTFGIKVSHSHRRTNRTFKPNVKKVKAVVNGTPCRVNVCSRCLRSGLVQRAG